MTNTLYYGDNVKILREYVPDESVDLIYLDPPFNSDRSFNVIFQEESGDEPEAQVVAFYDTWHWDATAVATYTELVTHGAERVSRAIGAIRELLGPNQMTAYLVMMAARLVELHRILKPTGSLYLHCDPTASHYLKVVLDAVFGPKNYRNEITWKRQSAHSDARLKFCDVADIIFFYVKSDEAQFKPQYGEYNPDYLAKFYRFDDNDGRGRYSLDNMASPNPRPNMMYEWMGFPCPKKGWRYQRETMQKLHDEGRIWYPRLEDGALDTTRRPRLKRYLEEQEGSIITNVWSDIQPLHAVTAERLGYPTQKPLALVERIIAASSNPGDVVLDPFCGCGTAIVAAHKLERKWIGIDITHLAVALLKYRLQDMFELDPKRDYAIVGEPVDSASAHQLALENRYQFQWWALSLVKAKPLGGDGREGAKGKDRGIDGVITFLDETTHKAKRVIVQVKSGRVKSGDVRDLRGVLEREQAAIAVFITLEEPTRDMQREAADAGFYHSPGWGADYPKVQLLTVDELLAGAVVKMPPTATTFKRAEKAAANGGTQQKNLL